MTVFTRARRATPPAPNRPTVPVVAYNNPSAAITVWADEDTWRLVIDPQNGPQGVFVFDARVPAENAAAWLAYQDLSNIARTGMSWVELVDAISDSRDGARHAQLCAELPGLSDAVIEHVLEVHYRQVLASKEGRRMWSKLLRDANTVEKAAQIRRDAR